MFYLVAMLALGLHFSHGIWSALQTLGLNHPAYNRSRRILAWGLAILVAGGLRHDSGRGDPGVLAMKLDARIPAGPLEDKWDRHRADLRLVSPANKRKFHVIVVGSGLAGASAAASLAELGYQVSCFCFQDSPRRAHSIAAQGGINAAKNYQNDGDSIWRLFYDTIKGGDFRSREANVYRLAQVSGNIIDQCVAQGVPFAREYGGMLANRSFGGAQVSRTFYARGQTGQQLLLGAYQALERMIGTGAVRMYRAPRNARAGAGERSRARHRRARPDLRRDAVVCRRRRGAGHRRLRQRLLPLDQRQGLQRHGDVPCLQERRRVRQPLLHADSSDLHSGERRLSVQAHPHVGIAAERRARLGAERCAAMRAAPARFPRRSATTTSSASIRRSETWRRATSHRARPRKRATRACGVGPGGRGVYLDFASAIAATR